MHIETRLIADYISAVCIVLTTLVGCSHSRPPSNDALACDTEAAISGLFRHVDAIQIAVCGPGLPSHSQILNRRDVLDRMADAVHIQAAYSAKTGVACTFWVEVSTNDDRGFKIMGEGNRLVVYPDLRFDSARAGGWYYAEVDPVFIQMLHEQMGSSFLEIFLSMCDEQDRLIQLNADNAKAADGTPRPAGTGGAATRPAEKQSP